MKPMIIVAPDVMTDAERAKLEANNICVVFVNEPGKVRFVDPIPALSSRTEMEHAAILLSRKLLNWPWDATATVGRDFVAKLYVNILLEGSALSQDGTKEEKEQRIYDGERRLEIEKIAREDARAEAAARKAAKAGSKA